MAKNKDYSDEPMPMPFMGDIADLKAGIEPELRYSDVETSGLRALDDPKVRQELGLDVPSDSDPYDLSNATASKAALRTLAAALKEAEMLKDEAIPQMDQGLGKSR